MDTIFLLAILGVWFFSQADDTLAHINQAQRCDTPWVYSVSLLQAGAGLMFIASALMKGGAI